MPLLMPRAPLADGAECAVTQLPIASMLSCGSCGFHQHVKTNLARCLVIELRTASVSVSLSVSMSVRDVFLDTCALKKPDLVASIVVIADTPVPKGVERFVNQPPISSKSSAMAVAVSTSNLAQNTHVEEMHSARMPSVEMPHSGVFSRLLNE